MAGPFKLKSGNSPLFKMMGSSPVKQEKKPVGPVVKEEDHEGTYYVMPKSDNMLEDDTESTVLMAFHESRVQESTVAWEIFRDVVSGKIKKDVAI